MHTKGLRGGLFFTLMLLVRAAAQAAEPPAAGTPPGFIWLEGEAARTTFAAGRNDAGRPHLLAGGQWLQVSVDADKVEAGVPAEGVRLDYAFQCARAARYEIWNRVGFEFARSAFEWRVDAQAWQTAAPEELTTDLVELGFWMEVAWLKLGAAELTAGEHHLEIRLAKVRDAKGQWGRLLYASDALCLTAGPFAPNGKYRPDESGRDDADRAATAHVFHLPAAAPGTRSSVRLDGAWEIGRDDEQMPGEVAEPIRELPKQAFWHAIAVPGDKGELRPELRFAHRVWYRTRVAVPAEFAGRACRLEFPGNNLNTTIFVNGVYCGFSRNPFAPFEVDITPGLRAGMTNEIQVGIRDAWYGRSADPARPLKLRKTFNFPVAWFHEGFQDLDYPVWNCPQSGILATPVLVAAGGPVAVADVFVKPAVAAHRLGAEVTVSNPGATAVAGEIRWEAVEDASGETRAVFPPQPFTAPAGGTNVIELSAPAENLQLWWPDAPHLYRLRTTVAVAGAAAADTRETLFGYREWGVAGTQFTLNGVVWHLWADLIGEERSPEAWLAAYRHTDQRTTRLSTAGQAGHDFRWLGLEPPAALEFCDRHGVVVRRNTTLDGETIGSQFSEGDPETRRQQGGSELKLALMRNWREQCVAQVRGERNHPSIQIWSLENEFAYINLINLLGNSPNMDRYEEEITRTHAAVRAADPTRPVMSDGGGATRKNTLGVQGDHYVATLDNRYPDLAYEPFVEGGGRGRWRWDQQRPRFIGEDFFATGINPADYARWGGEIAFQGKAAARGAVTVCYRMLMEGYRWGGHYAGWHLWLGADGGPGQWVANAPRAALVRQWDWTFGGGATVPRTYGLFNDTEHPEPLTFERRFMLGGKETFHRTTTHTVAPGTALKFAEDLPLPSVTSRQEGELRLTVSAGGREVFRDTKTVSVLPPVKAPKLAAGALAVWDPTGETSAWLRELGVAFTPVTGPGSLPAAVKILLVGRDALTEADQSSTALAVQAAAGRVVIVLDQTHPLQYQALPASLEPAPPFRKDDFGTAIPADEGRTAFVEDAAHPALAGLQDRDFFTWGPEEPAGSTAPAHLVYRRAYLKPARGAKSLVQCGPRLAHSALVEVPAGPGVLYLCQLDVGRRLGANAVARQLVVNLLAGATDYHPERAEVAAVLGNGPWAAAAAETGLQFSNAPTPLAAVGDPARRIAFVTATPANLRELAAQPAALEKFLARRGTLVLAGLTPEGLADFNRIVGVPHVLRPFTRERVTFPPVRHSLTAGLTTGDMVQLSGQRMFAWNADEYVAADTFGYVVDLEDLAPFAKSDFPSYDKIVNGFVGSDGWPLIIDFPHPRDGKPFVIQIDLPQPETIVEYTHDPSVNYNPTTKIALSFDGRNRREYALAPNGEAQTFAIDPPQPARRVTLELVSWQVDPAKAANIGIDNIYLKVARSAEWRATVKPLLNIGALVYYAKGAGGVLLCDLNWPEHEAVAQNRQKKLTILATLLRNLHAPFAGGRTVIAGGNLKANPVDLHTRATTYKDERGGFGPGNHTLKDLPTGEQVLAGVKFQLYELATSPVPQVLMLGGGGVPGNLPAAITNISVQQSADALFFLHTAKISRPRDDRERAENKACEIAQYVIHYADGQTARVPVRAEGEVDDFRQTAPRSLPGAQLAWTAPFADHQGNAAVYSLQWNNPRPGVPIASVDLVPGAEHDRGVPALLALTTVTVRN